jgi:hypothetical protein
MKTETVLKYQLDTGMTQDGREIGLPEGPRGERGLQILKNISNSLNNPELASSSMCVCNGCKFVLDNEYFGEGCMNCGSKDFREIGTKDPDMEVKNAET